jgi:hypothetical protein
MRKLTFVLLILLAVFMAVNSHAQFKVKIHPANKSTVKKTPAVLYKDTSAITVKQFRAKAFDKYRHNPEFNYDDYEGAGVPSPWDRFWNWVWQHLFGWIGRSKYGGDIVKYTLLGAGIALLVYAIIKSIGIDPIQLLRGDSKKVEMIYSESEEDIHGIDFDAEIEKAIAQNNFRLAVRLLYLRCLKQLNDSQLIQWQLDKTNSAYINELADPEQKKTFSLITRQFEYVWYGNFAIDKQAFVNIAQLFQNFKQQVR